MKKRIPSLSIVASFPGLICITFWQCVSGLSAEPMAHSQLDEALVMPATRELQSALELGTSLNSQQAAAMRAIELLGPDHYASTMIHKALGATALLDEQSAASQLRDLLQRIHASLTFRPLKEAPLPAGFPPFTPLHHVEVKRYPQYRLARTSMGTSTSENRAFLSLFNHIQRNLIAMTTPVQIDYADPEGPVEMTAMSFLYQRIDLGTAGQDPDDATVEVVDVPSRIVVSTGVRGPMSEQAVQAAREQLLAWLAAHADRYVADGAVRSMGYNSPFVPRGQQYFEVQIPVCDVATQRPDAPIAPPDV